MRTNGQIAPPVVYPSWEIDGVTYYLKLTFTSYFLLEQEGIRIDELQHTLASGKAPIATLIKIGAAMLGAPKRDGGWKSLGITATDLADAIGQGRNPAEALADFKDFADVVQQALKSPPAAVAAEPPAEAPALQ